MGRVVIRFRATESAKFECRLDRGRWSGCRSPKSYAALKRGDRAQVDAQQRRLGALAARKANPDDDDGDIQVAAVLDKELRAAISAADGKGEEAVAALREAATQEEAIPAAFGPPDVVKPVPELLGELLLARSLAFLDPVTGDLRSFTSPRSLSLTPR